MFEEIKNIQTGEKHLRSFGFTIGLIFLIISIFLFFKENESLQIFIYLSILFAGLGLILPKFLKPIYLIWMIFAVILGWFMTRIILSSLYLLVVTPIGITLRVLGKDLLELSKKEIQGSYWNKRDSGIEKNQDYKKQF
tara:strand:- start:647 stop:1060 length:414 start_codon:yes stop_codon:yes gene_type:complete